MVLKSARVQYWKLETMWNMWVSLHDSKFLENVLKKTISSKKCLSLDVPTQWNFTYVMLDTARVFQKVFERMEEEDVCFWSSKQRREIWWWLQVYISSNKTCFQNPGLNMWQFIFSRGQSDPCSPPLELGKSWEWVAL